MTTLTKPHRMRQMFQVFDESDNLVTSSYNWSSVLDQKGTLAVYYEDFNYDAISVNESTVQNEFKRHTVVFDLSLGRIDIVEDAGGAGTHMIDASGMCTNTGPNTKLFDEGTITFNFFDGYKDRTFKFYRGEDIYDTTIPGDSTIELLGTSYLPSNSPFTTEPLKILLPDGYDAAQSYPLVVFKGGLGQSSQIFLNGKGNRWLAEALNSGYIVAIVDGGESTPGANGSNIIGTEKVHDAITASINYTIDNYSVNEDKIFGVGFSAGANAIATYAALHRNPNLPMFAGIAINSPPHDWTHVYYYTQASPSASFDVQLEDAKNFGTDPFPPNDILYYTYSTFHWFPFSYDFNTTPTLNGSITDDTKQNLNNLTYLPLYHIFDDKDDVLFLDDTTFMNGIENEFFRNNILSYTTDSIISVEDPKFKLFSQGLSINAVQQAIGPGQVDMTPHSTFLLEPQQVFDFFEGVTCNREPLNWVGAFFGSGLDARRVSYAQVEPRVSTIGATANAKTDLGARLMECEAVSAGTYYIYMGTEVLSSIRDLSQGSVTITWDTTTSNSLMIRIYGLTQDPGTVTVTNNVTASPALGVSTASNYIEIDGNTYSGGSGFSTQNQSFTLSV